MGLPYALWVSAGRTLVRSTRSLHRCAPRMFFSSDNNKLSSHSTEAVSNDMDITFLGTSSGVPTQSRSTTCIALRYNGDIWLFDAGEGTQRQFQGSVHSPSMVRKIFISHMHGDHVFGLPSLLCEIGLAQKQRDFVVDIYGPEGLRDFLYTAILTTYSTVVPRFRVHEMKKIPCRRGGSRLSRSLGSRYGGSFLRAKDMAESRDLFPDSNGVYQLVAPNNKFVNYRGTGKAEIKGTDDASSLAVRAAPMDHSIPCVGFVITELDKRGMLRADRVADIIERNRDQIPAHFEVQRPEHVYKLLKALEPGDSITFPDGTQVKADDVLDPPRKGRKVVIMGDTCSGEYMRGIAMDADLVVHEATNAWTPGVSEASGHNSPKELERELISRGHSTPDMAGRFAARVRAKHLVLTHFSARFGGGTSSYELEQMDLVGRLAVVAGSKESVGNNTSRRGIASSSDTENGEKNVYFPKKVTTAWDHLTVNVDTRPRDSSSISRHDNSTAPLLNRR